MGMPGIDILIPWGLKNKMFNIIYETTSGKITRVISSSYLDFEPTLLNGESNLTSEDYVDDSLFYINQETVTAFPSKPSQYHIWDWTSKTYTLNTQQLNLAKEKKVTEIDKLRGSKALQSVTYDNKTLDADAQAQSNINGKLQEIFAREAISLPLVSGEMFWKDTNNVIHSWSNQTDYKLWLQGLVIAISSRNTQLYSIAWTKKAEVEALTGIDDILAYDINSGWT
jgi:hypothetical protein